MTAIAEGTRQALAKLLPTFAATELADAIEKTNEVTEDELAKLSGLTSSTAELNKLTGVTATPAELNLVDNQPANITMVAAPAAENVCEVTCTVVDAAGAAIAKPFNFDLWLSDAATGAGLTGTDASGTVTAKAASGIVLATYTAKKALRVQSLATGIFVLEITDTAATEFKIAAQVPGTGHTVVGETLAAADYGTA